MSYNKTKNLKHSHIPNCSKKVHDVCVVVAVVYYLLQLLVVAYPLGLARRWTLPYLCTGSMCCSL